MKVATRTTNGIRALVELTIHHEERPISIKFLAKRLGISRYYLENLMLLLKRNGLVEPSRGPKGGYSLARHPADIYLNEVFVTLEGSTTLVYCANCPDNCSYYHCCSSRDLLNLLTDTMAESLSHITLKSLAERQVFNLEKILA